MVPWRSHATPSPHLGTRSGCRRGHRRARRRRLQLGRGSRHRGGGRRERRRHDGRRRIAGAGHVAQPGGLVRARRLVEPPPRGAARLLQRPGDEPAGGQEVGAHGRRRHRDPGSRGAQRHRRRPRRRPARRSQRHPALHRQRRGGRAGPAPARRDLPAAVGARPGHVERLEDQGRRGGVRQAHAQAERGGRLRAGRRPGHPRQVHQRAAESLLQGPRRGGHPRRRVGQGTQGGARPRDRQALAGARLGVGHAHRRRARPLALGAAPLRHGAVREGVRRRRAAS